MKKYVELNDYQTEGFRSRGRAVVAHQAHNLKASVRVGPPQQLKQNTLTGVLFLIYINSNSLKTFSN